MPDCFVVLKSKPYYDDDAGRYHYPDWPVLVVQQSNETEMKAFIDGLNAKVEAHVDAIKRQRASIHRKQELMKELDRKPPYAEIVAIVGPKPAYDHSREKDKEYNDAHVGIVAGWREQFKIWAIKHPDEWKARREALVSLMIEEVNLETLGDDEFDIANSITVEDNWRGYDRYDRYVYPRFSVEIIKLRATP